MSDPALEKLLRRLHHNLAEDKLIQKVTNDIRNKLSVDRVALYYFYRQWEGRVTFESLSSPVYSILGSTGPEECFNQEYADLYKNGRISSIANVDDSNIAECHRDFLTAIQVKANLVAPILTPSGLWGLLVAHHCQNSFDWTPEHIQLMQTGAQAIAEADAIRNN